MRTITLFFTLIFISAQAFSDNVWSKLDLNKAAGGGTINMNINRLYLNDGKLYAATQDGIWVSPSANGGDWEPYGLQGKNARVLNFDNLKLAVTTETAANDASKTAFQLYKFNGTDWVLTKYNQSKQSTFGGPATSFAQIKDGSNTNIIIMTSWGGGIWRSADDGENWTNYTTEGDVYRNVLGAFTFAGNNTIYATDKAINADHYLLYSEDYGLTWNYKTVGNFSNPYCVLARKVETTDYVFFAGENSNAGIVWRSQDKGAEWDASFTSGGAYWNVRKIIGENDGPIYALASVSNVFISTDNGDSFAPLATGITIPGTRTSPASGTYFLSDIVQSSAKVYVSAIKDEGIYVYNKTSTAVNNAKPNAATLYFNTTLNQLEVNTEVGAKIAIYTVSGKLIKSQIATQANTHINVQALYASVYIVKCISESGNTLTNRFVKTTN